MVDASVVVFWLNIHAESPTWWSPSSFNRLHACSYRFALSSDLEIYNKFAGSSTQNNLLKQKQISQAVKEFISDDMYNKRNTLMNLLVRSCHYENQYLAYLLYDLLSNDLNGNVDTQ